jgi:hypothetical protein
MIELLDASRWNMARFEREDGSYVELGGGLVEEIVEALVEPLQLSVEYYDEDSADFIETLFQTTVSLTIGFSFALVLYYFTIIYILLQRLQNVMVNEFNFFMILPRGAVANTENDYSVEEDTTKEQLNSQ